MVEMSTNFFQIYTLVGIKRTLEVNKRGLRNDMLESN